MMYLSSIVSWIANSDDNSDEYKSPHSDKVINPAKPKKDKSGRNSIEHLDLKRECVTPKGYLHTYNSVAQIDAHWPHQSLNGYSYRVEKTQTSRNYLKGQHNR